MFLVKIEIGYDKEAVLEGGWTTYGGVPTHFFLSFFLSSLPFSRGARLGRQESVAGSGLGMVH